MCKLELVNMVSSYSQIEEIEKALYETINLSGLTLECHGYCSKNVSIQREARVTAAVISVGVYIW